MFRPPLTRKKRSTRGIVIEVLLLCSAAARGKGGGEQKGLSEGSGKKEQEGGKRGREGGSEEGTLFSFSFS